MILYKREFGHTAKPPTASSQGTGGASTASQKDTPKKMKPEMAENDLAMDGNDVMVVSGALVGEDRRG